MQLEYQELQNLISLWSEEEKDHDIAYWPELKKEWIRYTEDKL